ncbi:hypothetical protein QE152_g7504 [Popillia japonica]|uniref:Uncharacterized protein n=1 Tax=Popillia japonica TaxID=7064 RepID=A0AAW1MEP9_POPJA
MLKNLMPFYQTQFGLVEIKSIPELLKYGKQLEARKASVEAYVPPPLRGKSLEPDLALRANAGTVSSPVTDMVSADRLADVSAIVAVDLVSSSQIVQHKVIDMLVVPEVSHTLILGADFWRTMGIVPGLRRAEWIFSTDAANLELCPLDDASFLSEEHQRLLESTIVKHFPDNTDSDLGCAIGVEHVITTSSPPIKQRYYPISPAMQKIVDAELEKMLALEG